MKSKRMRPPLERRELFSGFVKFEFTDAPVYESSRIAREFALWPVSNACGVPPGKPRLSARVVLDRYRNQLSKLHKLGCKQMKTLTSVVAAANCLPETVRCTVSSSLTCEMTLCPWCHTRRVTDYLKALKVNDKEACNEFMANKRLLHLWRPSAADQAMNDRRVQPIKLMDKEAVRRALETDAVDCQQVASGLNQVAEGVVWFVKNWPGSFGDPEVPVLCSVPTVVALVEKGTTPVVPRDWQGTVFFPTKDETDQLPAIKRAFQTAFRFAPELLTGPPEDVMQLLEARAGLRLLVAKGAFRAPRGSGRRKQGRKPKEGQDVKPSCE